MRLGFSGAMGSLGHRSLEWDEELMRKLLSSRPLRSLATRINLLIFVATAASSIAISAISLQSLDAFLKARVDQRYPQIARRVSADLEHWYALRAREIEVFARSSVLLDSVQVIARDGRRETRARNEAKQYLQYVVENFPHFERIVLTDEAGNPLVDVGSEGSVAGEWTSSISSVVHRTTISPLVSLGKRRAQIASTPMENLKGRLGHLHAVIDLSQLEPILASDELEGGARVLLVDSDHRYVNPPENLPAEARYAEAVGDEPLDQETAVIHFDAFQNRRVVSARTEFTRFDWLLIVEQPYDEVFAPVVASMKRAIGFSFAIVLACCYVALRLARSIVRPLGALADGARRLSEGEREVEIGVTRSSEEIQLLTHTFNDMSRTLASTTRELEQNQEAIESANEELVGKNEELSAVNLILEQLSITDGLTKLHNHRYFQDAMQRTCKRCLRSKSPLSLLLIDIDFFKLWNDRLGHAGGDEILRRIAELLNEQVRETDLLARYGGEEFAVLASDTTLEGAVALAEKLRETVATSNFLTDLPSEKSQLSVSIGVAEFRGDRKQLFADADEALYQAKDAGRNCVIGAQTDEVFDGIPDENSDTAANESDE